MAKEPGKSNRKAKPPLAQWEWPIGPGGPLWGLQGAEDRTFGYLGGNLPVASLNPNLANNGNPIPAAKDDFKKDLLFIIISLV